MGINTAVSAVGSNIGFAIPVTQECINATLASIQKYGNIVRPFLGIKYIDLNPASAKELKISIEK
jgi:S1-C subfamily serine protease